MSGCPLTNATVRMGISVTSRNTVPRYTYRAEASHDYGCQEPELTTEPGARRRAKCVKPDVCPAVHAARFGHSGWFSQGRFTAPALPFTPDGRPNLHDAESVWTKSRNASVRRRGGHFRWRRVVVWRARSIRSAGGNNDYDGSGRLVSHPRLAFQPPSV
jgi:hypothetical protein